MQAVLTLGRVRVVWGPVLQLWDAIKDAASSALLRTGGTCTHHHAVGRDHRPYYAKEVGRHILRVLWAAKRELDPQLVCNPGVLLPLTSNI